jgi:hypothetical protein
MTESPLIRLDQTADSSSSSTVRVGIYTGALLVIVMLGALVAANRVAALERYALERNAISYTLFMLFMLIPVVRFSNRPIKMFGSAMIAWTMFAVAYDFAGMAFQNLFDSVRHTPLVAFCEGGVVYGVCSVFLWVGGMILHARRHSIAPRRKGARTAAGRDR